MQYKSGVARNLRKIGKELGVAHVLEGSVQRAAKKVRVIAQLIDARNDAHLWAQTHDRDWADVFAIQSEIAKAIADQLQAKFSGIRSAAIRASRKLSPRLRRKTPLHRRSEIRNVEERLSSLLPASNNDCPSRFG
jgi:hypothetical protein